MPELNPHASGIDFGATSHYALSTTPSGLTGTAAEPEVVSLRFRFFRETTSG